MSKRVSFKLRGENEKAALSFANQVGQPLDKIAEVAFFRYVNDVLDKAEKMARDAADKATGVAQTNANTL